MLWYLLQGSIVLAVTVSNAIWHWVAPASDPSGGMAAGVIGILAALLVTGFLSAGIDRWRRWRDGRSL